MIKLLKHLVVKKSIKKFQVYLEGTIKIWYFDNTTCCYDPKGNVLLTSKIIKTK